jgi:hypothetical protein
MSQMYTIATASFSVGLLGGYLVNRYGFLLRSVLGIKSKRPAARTDNKRDEAKSGGPATSTQAPSKASSAANSKKNDDFCGDVETNETTVGIHTLFSFR